MDHRSAIIHDAVRIATQKMGYSIVSYGFVNPDRSCTPIGALWLTNREALVSREFQRVYLEAFDNKFHPLYQQRNSITDPDMKQTIEDGHAEGRAARKRYLGN